MIRLAALLSPPSQALDLAVFLAADRPALAAEWSLTRAVLDEREEGR